MELKRSRSDPTTQHATLHSLILHRQHSGDCRSRVIFRTLIFHMTKHYPGTGVITIPNNETQPHKSQDDHNGLVNIITHLRLEIYTRIL